MNKTLKIQIVLAVALAATLTASVGAASERRPAAPLPARFRPQIHPSFWSWAQTPPMGWNSWDSFATTVTEVQTKAQADYMAAKLKRYGWRYVVVDIQWYEPEATGFAYRENAKLALDDWGRLQPASNKFPSAANGAGFQSLADYIHSKGLKFGIHVMRGIPRLAVIQNTPIRGTTARAADIADKGSTCPWNSDMYGVDMDKPGAQEYYDSLYAMFAAWGVDFVKVDDLSAPYHQAEIEAIRKAIDKTGRPMVLSTSPGETPVSAGTHVEAHANMWRVSNDFWDDWPALSEQFARLDNWTPFRGMGHFPDADMLPLGAVRQVGGGRPWTNFTKDEQVTMMSLWAIARSPLMMGGDLTKNDDWTVSLLTNGEVLDTDQRSTHNRQLFNREGIIAWAADIPGSRDKYLAVFNTRDVRTLDTGQALFRSSLLTRQTPGHGIAVDVDITSAKKLFLAVDDGGDGFAADHFDWAEPRLIGPAGELKLSDLTWVSATTGWGQVSKQQAAGGHAMSIDGKPVAYGIGTHATSILEFDLPAGYTRFKTFAGLDDEGTSQPFGATVHALVFTHSPFLADESVPVPVSWQEIGLSGRAQVRDLWLRRDIGVFRDHFAPLVRPHAARLYRITPL